jgi:SSS family solute:Na+ symporter
LTAAVVALGIVAAVVLGVIALGIASTRGVLMNPEQYIVGGRTFGALLLWLLMAGEIYTSFTFLGAAGWAYGKGAPAFYILCYGTVAYIISYFLLPPVWRVAKRYRMLTGPDFFAVRYRSKALGVIVALIGFFFLVPYVTLQLAGLQILLSIAGYGAFHAVSAVALAFLLIALFVFLTGLRGLAWASVAKDTMVLLGVIFAGIVLPVHFLGSPARAMSKVLELHPHWLTLAPGSQGFGTTWFVSTVLLTAFGFWMWPQSMAAAYSAKSDDALRRNAIFMPLYQVMLLLVFFAGITALVVLPGLAGPAADQSFMLVVQKYYPPWVLGLLAGAGCLAALIPASGQLLAASSIVVKNVLGDWLHIATTDVARTRATRILVVAVAVLALAFWVREKTTLVNLLLIAYTGIAQFFPGTVLAFCWRRATAWGVASGMLTGVVVVTVLAVKGLSTVAGINAGLFALVFNTAACILISLLTQAPDKQHLDDFEVAASQHS